MASPSLRSSRSSAFVSILLAGVVVAVSATGCGPHVPPEPVVCSVDNYEGPQGNDTQATAFDLGSLRDDPDSSLGITASAGTDDVDWYRVHVTDTGGGGNPNIRVTITEGFAVSSWFVCDGGHSISDQSCLDGSYEPSEVDGHAGCRGETIGSYDDENGNYAGYSSDRTERSTTDCSGTTDDNGFLYIRVDRASSYGACSYDLTINVD